jgi:hypothetical protein
VRDPTAVAEAVDGHGTALDFRHDPGDENYENEWNGFGDDSEQRGHLCARLCAIWIGRVEFVADAVGTESNGGDHHNKDEQAPAGAEAVFAEKDVAQSGRRRWNDLVNGSRFVAAKQGVLFGRIIQNKFLRSTPTITYTQRAVRWFPANRPNGRDRGLA